MCRPSRPHHPTSSRRYTNTIHVYQTWRSQLLQSHQLSPACFAGSNRAPGARYATDAATRTTRHAGRRRKPNAESCSRSDCCSERNSRAFALANTRRCPDQKSRNHANARRVASADFPGVAQTGAGAGNRRNQSYVTRNWPRAFRGERKQAAASGLEHETLHGGRSARSAVA